MIDGTKQASLLGMIFFVRGGVRRQRDAGARPL